MDDAILTRGREAAAAGNWAQACELLIEADALNSLRGPDLALLAGVAYAAGKVDLTIESWERSYAQALQANDCVGAAGAAAKVALHLLFDTALMAPVRGWTKRAERLLENQEETPVHAWLALIRSYERLLSGEFPRAREWARRAIEVGTRCEPAVAAMGRVAEARSLILDGEVPIGLELLEEAGVATVSGELDPLCTGVVYCELVCALQALAQYDLAEEWTQAMEKWRHGRPVGSIHGRCRVHRAEILRLRGFSSEAEQEALRACEELRPYVRREYGWPLTELGRVRLRRGDLDGAEQAFVAAQEAGWDPQPGPALVLLARGDPARAAATIRDAIEHPLAVPSKELPPNTGLREAPLLEAQVEIAVAAGDLDRASWAADALAQVADKFRSKPLAASAALARGRLHLAKSDPAAARREFAAAMTLWSEVGAPFEKALARTGLAESLLAAGDRERALVELRATQSTFEQIGARLHAQRAADACAALEPGGPGQPPGDERHTPVEARGVAAEARKPVNAFRREGEFWSVTFEDATVRLRDAKGLRYLVRLLADPHREFHVLELIAAECGWPADARSAMTTEPGHAFLGDAGALLDARAKAAYRRRLAEIEEDLEEARATGDVPRQAQASTEREVLVRELSRAVGLGGRDRRAGSAAERARVSVTRSVRSVLVRIREHSAALGEHLDRCIRTGTRCAYQPDPRSPVEWMICDHSARPARPKPVAVRLR
jgi:tetratricopeptide (TPR) repeat protein